MNAFWFLGSGILADGGACSGHTGPCYYAQSQLTSSANGAPGTPSWTVVQNGQGQISLSCYDCANPIATAQSGSSSCLSDIQVYVSYGGYTSAAFNVIIVYPHYTDLQAGYPTTGSWSTGYLTHYVWSIVDSCGNLDGGIDANEKFGTFHDDISNDWLYPTANGAYLSGYLVGDDIGHVGGSPPAQPPGSGTTQVRHNYPWALRIGSQTIGSGLPARVDTQAEYLDHGEHY